MTQYIIITALIVIAVILAIANANQQKHIREQIDTARQKADERQKALQEKMDRLTIEIADKNRTIEKQKMFLDAANDCLPNGYPYAYDYAIVRSEYRICVRGIYKSYGGTETTACIKAIPIEDDEEFAIREAEELVEILNEK